MSAPDPVGVLAHLEALLRCVKAGELAASVTEIARLEGAVVALRAVCTPDLP